MTGILGGFAAALWLLGFVFEWLERGGFPFAYAWASAFALVFGVCVVCG